jgi:hypothetical protein
VKPSAVAVGVPKVGVRAEAVVIVKLMLDEVAAR